MRSWLVEFTVIVVIAATVGFAYAGPTEANSSTPMREVSFNETPVVCKDFQTSVAKISEDARREMPAIYAAMKSAGVTQTAAPILIFKPGADPQIWEATVAVPVDASAKAPAGYLQRTLAAGKAEASVYHGDEAHIGQAFAKIHQDLAALAVNSTGEFREHVLYWPGNDSPNVVLLIEVPLAE